MEAVSAVIPVHNGETTIARALRSVLDQNYANLQIIVVNDGSSDATGAIVDGFAPSITLINQPNAGPAAARNAGIAAARAEYVAFLDADDAWLAGKLAALVDALRHDHSAVLAFSDVTPVDACGMVLAPNFMPRDCAHAPSMEELLTRWWPIFPSSVVMRRAALLACRGFDAGFVRPGYEDPLLWLHARRLGRFLYIDRPLVAYRLAPELERMEKYAHGIRLFADRVGRDFGRNGRALLDELSAAHLSALGAHGLRAMEAGDWAEARRAFRCALLYRPANLRILARLARSYLPARVSSALSSPRRRRRRRESGIRASRDWAQIQSHGSLANQRIPPQLDQWKLMPTARRFLLLVLLIVALALCGCPLLMIGSLGYTGYQYEKTGKIPGMPEPSAAPSPQPAPAAQSDQVQ